MGITTMIALIFLICLVAPAAFAWQDNKCLLIFEGVINRFLIPTKLIKNTMPVWQSVDENGLLMKEYFSMKTNQDWQLKQDGWTPLGYAVARLKHGCLDYRDIHRFRFVHFNEYQFREWTWIYRSKMPLNTLCYPQPGVVKNFDRRVNISTTTSLAECALLVANKHDDSYGVQWDVNHSGYGQCYAFYSSNSPLYISLPRKANLFLPDTRYYIGLHISCILKPMLLPVTHSKAGERIDVNSLEACIMAGSTRGKTSVSFDTAAGCHIFDTPEYAPSGSNTPRTCDVLPMNKLPTTTTTTTTTTATTTTTTTTTATTTSTGTATAPPLSAGQFGKTFSLENIISNLENIVSRLETIRKTSYPVSKNPVWKTSLLG